MAAEVLGMPAKLGSGVWADLDERKWPANIMAVILGSHFLESKNLLKEKGGSYKNDDEATEKS